MDQHFRVNKTSFHKKGTGTRFETEAKSPVITLGKLALDANAMSPAADYSDWVTDAEHVA